MAVLLFVSSMTFGQFKTGNQLYEDLKVWDSNVTDQNYFQSGTSFGYVMGVFDSLEAFAPNVLDRPANITASQVMDVVIKYFKEHPEERHERANVLINRALLEAWPKKSPAWLTMTDQASEETKDKKKSEKN